jgi:hypothetical protein
MMAPRKPPAPSPPRSNALVNLAQALVQLLFGAALVLGTLAARERGLLDDWLGPASRAHAASAPAPEEPAPGGDPQWVRSAARLFDPSTPSRVIYLNREGAELRGGPDDSSINVSSVVVGSPGQRARLPAFAGTAERWKQIVSCIRGKFAPFDVRVVEQRPIAEDYLMVMLGGHASDLGFNASDGHKHSHATGLAPFNGENIASAVVFVFTRTLREAVKTSCEAAGMEVAHAYGLDHARHCKDLMTYLPNCGPRTFLDKDLPCGEHADRACEGKLATQNSYRRLMTLLGPPVAAATR